MSDPLPTPSQEPNELGLVFTEWYKNTAGLSFRIREILADVHSEFQHIQIFQTESHGRLLVHDDCVMLSERDEAVYHEMIAHVPLLTHPHPQKVLVVGGGDGGTLREVLRHDTVQTARQVEIDGEVVRLAREHLPGLASAYDHPKADLIIGDGVRHMAEAEEAGQDVVIVDSTDPFGPALDLFGEEFYRNVHRVLAEDGVLAVQAENYVYDMEMLESIVATLRRVFPLVRVYTAQIPVYPSGTWCFVLASKGPDPLKLEVDDPRMQLVERDARYWNRELHFASFALPTQVRQRLDALA
jgi:spermidine synthase